ncbi:GntR family transcriptional regulator [Roseburia hominis]
MLERNTPKPLYQQLKGILMDEIEAGKWEPNEKIPSENELSSLYGLSRMTARAVVSDLVKEGLLYRVQGKGTFVSEKILTLSPSYVGIREQLEQMGYEVKTRIVECKTIKSTGKIAKNLDLLFGDSVFMIKRIRYIEDAPISLHVSYINEKYREKLSEDLLEREQLCVILNEEYGLTRQKVSETLESIIATKEEGSLLEVEAGHPLLLLEDVIYDTNNVPYEYTKVLFRGDKIKIKLQYD